LDPTNIVPVQDCSPATLRALIALLERSVTFDHLIYRESEMDALWTQAEMGVRAARSRHASADEVESLERMFAAAQAAHDLVAAGAPERAAARLREALAQVERANGHSAQGRHA
jgi:hypothetical protein